MRSASEGSLLASVLDEDVGEEIGREGAADEACCVLLMPPVNAVSAIEGAGVVPNMMTER